MKRLGGRLSFLRLDNSLAKLGWFFFNEFSRLKPTEAGGCAYASDLICLGHIWREFTAGCGLIEIKNISVVSELTGRQWLAQMGLRLKGQVDGFDRLVQREIFLAFSQGRRARKRGARRPWARLAHFQRAGKGIGWKLAGCEDGGNKNIEHSTLNIECPNGGKWQGARIVDGKNGYVEHLTKH